MKNTFMGFVGALVMIASIGLVAALMAWPVPESNRDLLNILSGVLFGWGGAVVTFYFGSSKSSRDKDEKTGIGRNISQAGQA